MEVTEKCLNSELWHACAGGMVQMPTVNSKVFYFSQGHAEHTLTTVDFGGLLRISAMILCRVGVVQYLGNCIKQSHCWKARSRSCPSFVISLLAIFSIYMMCQTFGTYCLCFRTKVHMMPSLNIWTY